MIQAGELRNRIEIQKYGRVPNEIGEGTKDWVPYVKVWAKFPSDVGRQLKQQAEKETAKLIYEIVIRYRSDIDTMMRVAYKGKFYNINHVTNHKELNIETHLFCTLIEEGVRNE